MRSKIAQKILDETPELKKEKVIEHAKWIIELNKSGYAGILPTGEIVDRREHPEAIPIQKNTMFNVSKPKKL